jgi:hypothetical protein
VKLAAACRQISPYALSIVASVAAACGPTTPVIDSGVTSVIEVAGARAATRPGVRSRYRCGRTRCNVRGAGNRHPHASIEHREETATAQALRSLVEQGIAATAAPLPTITPVAPTSTPQPPRRLSKHATRP